MGPQGTGKGFQGDIVLDAGALIAFERGDEGVRGLLRGALAVGSRVYIPASALAQVWRKGQGSALLARILRSSELDSLDEGRAKEVGQRLGEHGMADIADAHVVCCAVETSAAIATSDSRDIEALSDPGEKLVLIAV